MDKKKKKELRRLRREEQLREGNKYRSRYFENKKKYSRSRNKRQILEELDDELDF